jgi:multidrug resistance efflux pump
VIARLESADYEAALLAANANVAAARRAARPGERDFEARAVAARRRISCPTPISRARRPASTSLGAGERRRARRRARRGDLENTRVRAPFDGTVLRKDAEVGEIVAPSSAGGGLTRTAIVTMADLATLEVEVDVNEAYIAQIRTARRRASRSTPTPTRRSRAACARWCRPRTARRRRCW